MPSKSELNNVTANIDFQSIRKQFPILKQKINGYPLIYFDNAATTQKPETVIKSISDYYHNYNANIHRGIHTLAEKATQAFESTREKARAFINADSTQEIIFTYGTTDGLNLAARTLGKHYLKKGDEVIISGMEHHSNIVPWQIICEEQGAILKIIPVTESGEIHYQKYVDLLGNRTKIVSVVHVSNTLGTVNPVKRVVQAAHEAGAIAVIDGAQAAPHLKIDVQAMDCDFYALSSHKMFGPTGVGILFGKRGILQAIPPYRGGGEMIKEVTFEKTTYNDLPFKFEAGTPNIADVVGFGEAIDYLGSFDKHSIQNYEQELLQYGIQKLSGVKGLRLIGTAQEKISVISFVIDHIHPFDIGMMLDAGGIAVRTGHHCTQPLMDFFSIEGTVRVSLSIYNTKDEIDILADKLQRIVKIKKR